MNKFFLILYKIHMTDPKDTNNSISENNIEDLIINSNEAQKNNKEIETISENNKNEEIKTTNLDDVILPDKKEEQINQIKSNDEIKYTPHEESERDIFEEDEDRKNKKRLTSLPIVLIIIAILALALRQIIRNKPNITNLFNNWSWNIQTWSMINTWNTETWNTETWNTKDKNNNKSSSREKLDNFYSIEKNWDIYYNDTIIENTDKESFKALWDKYAKDKNNVYYEWNIVENAQSDKFYVIDTKGTYELKWTIVTSKNLLEHLKVKENREFLMTTIAWVTNKNINVKEELKIASIYSMNTFKNDYETLNKLQRWDKITDIQKAKFGVIFLYIKIIKNLESDKIRMSTAKAELKYFVEHSDEILKTYWTETTKPDIIKWNLWYDEYCIYQDGNLFGCFLNKIFITKR